MYYNIKMGYFDYLNTFFFISLGITFVLILLLVNHFKKRIVSFEKKSDTMFDIINNIVKELSTMKQSLIARQSGICMPPVNFPSQMMYTPPPMPQYNEPLYKYVSDNEDMSSKESDTESDSDDSDSDDSDDSYESDEEENVNEENIQLVKEDTHTENVEPENAENDPLIKIVNIHLVENDANQISEEYGDNVSLGEISDSEDNTNIEIQLDAEPIQVNKLETTIEVNEPVSHSIEIDKDAYKKMNINQLRAAVLAKGLTMEAGKLKKTELLKLLESE